MFEYIRLLVTARREECAARICEYHEGGSVISGDWIRTRVECTEVITSRWIVVNDRKQEKLSAILALNRNKI